MRHMVSLVVGGVLLVTGTSAVAAYISPASFVDQPGMVLMIDGKDRDSQVRLDLRIRGNTAGLDFGYISGDSFSSLSGQCCSKSGTVFAGGTLVDFAVRSQGADNEYGTADDRIFRLSDTVGYADQYYSGRIKPPKSRNPEVTDLYYSSLAMIWGLDRDGIMDLKVSLNSQGSFDGYTYPFDL